jgi:3-deoxy-manno-octulosonate cytidylyltransferase (CMP-KDO synthetase)
MVSIAGKPLIQWTIIAAKACAGIKNVVVATDSMQIAELVKRWVPVHLSTNNYWCGTQRVAACAETMAEQVGDYVINLQVDEPMIRPDQIQAVLRPLSSRHPGDIATLYAPLPTVDNPNHNVVKTWVGGGRRRQRCVAFSRQHAKGAMKHIGVYAFTKNILGDLGRLKQTDASKSESLEQITWLEAGMSIYAAATDVAPVSINTREDVLVMERILREC